MSDLSLEKFTIYSHVHNRQMKYLALIESFGKTFRDLIVITNNVLTANLDLEEIVEVDELNCLQYLRQWFERGDISTEEGESVELNVAQLCFDNVFHTIIDQNHPNFVELLQTKVELAEYVLFPNFKNDSMIYVKKVIEEKIKNQIVL